MASKIITDKDIRKMQKEPGKHRIAPHLFLRVRDTGAAFWAFLYISPKTRKQREAGLGSYPVVSLDEARVQAAAMRLHLKRDGTDPLAKKESARAKGKGTFARIALDYVEAKRSGWANAKHAGQWVNTLETYAFPVIGAMPVADVETEHVLRVLQPLWADKHETATRLRQRIEAVLDAATARKVRTGENPARWKGHLDKLLPTISKRVRTKNHPALPWRECPDFIAELRTRDGVSARALLFTILTACRTGEVIAATWAEIDLEQAVWTIPAVRMKAKREHRVPLSAQALALLNSLPRVMGVDHIFPGARSGLSNMAMLKLLNSMRTGMTVHGFRSTFRDWVSDATNFSGEIAEQALAHTIRNSTEAAYRRGDLLERRRELMQAWADYVGGSQHTKNVLPMRRKA
jgi:integrase